MTKKILSLVITITLCTVLCVSVCADYLGKIEGQNVNYPIILDGKKVDGKIPMIMVDDRIYLPIRAMCDLLGNKIEWNDEGRVEIMTDRENFEKGPIEVGYYGIDGWTVTKTFDLKISEEAALAIANDVFLAVCGEEYIEETVVNIVDADDGENYSVYRYEEDPYFYIDGGTVEVKIRKSDGKVLKVELGE